MLLSIQIVNYNSRENLVACLDSIRENTNPELNFQIIVVNNERNEFGEELRDFPGIELVEQKNNVGFGRAHNLGSKRAEGKYLLFLNPDTKIFPESLENLVKIFEADEKVGIAGPFLFDEKGQAEKGHYGKHRTPFSTIWDKLLPAKSKFSPQNIFETDWVSGGAMMIRKSLFEELGRFDENYFMYFEDVDLCLRARNKGWRVVVDPKSKVLHQGGKSFSREKDKKKYYYQSQDYYLKKNFGLVPFFFVKLMRIPFYFKNVYLNKR